MSSALGGILRRGFQERIRRRRQRTLLVSGVVLLVAVAAAIWVLTRPSAEETWQVARKNIRSATQASIDVRATMGGGAQNPDYVLTGSGVIDQDALLGAITYDFSRMPGNQAGAFGTLERVDAIYEGGRFLLGFPNLDEFLDRDEPWVAFDPDAVGLALGADIGQLRTLASLDPFLLISLLDGASERSWVEGSERPMIGFDIDVAEAAAGAPAQLEDLYDLLLSERPDGAISGELAVAGTTTELTIRDGVPVALGSDQTVPLEVVLRIETAAGVDIARPDDDQIVTVQDLIERLDRPPKG